MCVPDFILVHVVSLATRNISLTVALQKKVRELEGIIGELHLIRKSRYRPTE